MEGAVELAEEIFHAPVRLASPQFVVGLDDVVNNPIHSTGVGLLHYALLQSDAENKPSLGFMQETENLSTKEGLSSRIKRWFQRQF